MQGGAVQREDPRQSSRIAIVTIGSILLVASGFFAAEITLHPDGTHGPLIDIHPLRLGVFIVFALLALTVARNPFKPDVRVAQAFMLAAAVIALVVGLAGLLEAQGRATVAAGVAPYLQATAAILFLFARWARGLWPATRWDLSGAPGRQRA